ncbi:hypothetical protein [Hyalangium gracile]|uniref:hypothetical protein n=1 Tax=Hyalangium gracile TaxID=394092 RepID=UPI001CCE1497|nr:hypothetical protein [Hyalangium gracile]
MRREVCFLIDGEGRILWSDASTSPVSLPDSRARWEAIWSRRAQLAEISHSHPVGPLAFSHEDETTMEALIVALGTRPRFSVVAPDGMIVRDRDGQEARVAEEPWWTQLLRLASGMAQPGGAISPPEAPSE